MRVLILGGTSEAHRLADALATMGTDAIYSYAGRTEAPIRQPLPTRVGGFGGTDGLIGFLRAEQITHIIDATHPFAAEMSRNAAAACWKTGTPLLALERVCWTAMAGDRWIDVPDFAAAAAALPDSPAHVFLAIGRQHLAHFAVKPQHQYTLRLVDPPEGALPLPMAEIVVARGPFSFDSDLELMRSQAIEWVVSRNSGGDGARAKIEAARALGLPVVMIERPVVPERPHAATVEEAVDWLRHSTCLGA